MSRQTPASIGKGLSARAYLCRDLCLSILAGDNSPGYSKRPLRWVFSIFYVVHNLNQILNFKRCVILLLAVDFPKAQQPTGGGVLIVLLFFLLLLLWNFRILTSHPVNNLLSSEGPTSCRVMTDTHRPDTATCRQEEYSLSRKRSLLR